MALNVRIKNLELWLDTADFAKFLAMEDFKHYGLLNAVVRTSDGEGVISILIQIILES